MTEAQAQVDSALSGNAGCDAGFDCVLIQTPCEVVENECGFQVAAVNVAAEAAVEHAFSITGAEVCGGCTPEETEEDEGDFDGAECTDTAGAACLGGQCTVISLPPDAGSFFGHCGGACTQEQYCDVETELVACPGAPPGWFDLVGDGDCESLNSFESPGSSCSSDAECGLGLACAGQGPDGPIGNCTTSCPNAGEQPTSCGDGGCELATNNHGCFICFCPNGCPVLDGGLPDGGLGDGG